MTEPEAGDRASSRWDDDVFRARIARLSAERGRSVSEVCYAAGLSRTYLARPAGKSGRSIDALLSLARELNVGLIELINSRNGHDSTPSDENLTRLLVVAEVAAYLFLALGARPHIPSGFNAVEMVALILRHLESGDLKSQHSDQREQREPFRADAESGVSAP